MVQLPGSGSPQQSTEERKRCHSYWFLNCSTCGWWRVLKSETQRHQCRDSGWCVHQVPVPNSVWEAPQKLWTECMWSLGMCFPHCPHQNWWCHGYCALFGLWLFAAAHGVNHNIFGCVACWIMVYSRCQSLEDWHSIKKAMNFVLIFDIK